MEDAPPNHFFLEYISRPQTAEIFFEDVLMALVFYSMPILAENNKPRLLYYLKLPRKILCENCCWGVLILGPGAILTQAKMSIIDLITESFSLRENCRF